MRQGGSGGWFAGTVLHVCVCDWCVRRVPVLTVCVHRKRGVPQGSVLGLAQTSGVWGNSQRLEKQFPETCKQPKATRPQGNGGPSPKLTIQMSNVLKTIQEVAKSH